ncbi:MAG: HD domain-containing protein [Lachnospiraceae bacterium]|nr:HD domain-containing protein [Lachnospiraceae bacterium]
MEHCKLQIGCMLIILYILFIYCKECIRYKQKHKFSVFDALLVVGIFSVFFDGLTAYTVNHLEQVHPTLNMLFHLCFLLGLDCFIFRLFVYMLSITAGLPKKRVGIWLMYSPLVVNVILVIVYIPELEYIKGDISNYSMGMSAYTCFAMAAIYILLSILIFFGRWRYIERHKRISILTYLLMMAVLTAYQMFHPEALLTSLCVTLIIVGVYMNQENPSVLELARYHEEMTMGFATLVENKDGSTGGHIKRTTMYVRLLAEELRRRGYYREILTKDYVRNLSMSAPMHDIGKISVPDVILQKPGRLTEEEFARMKQHAESGGKIIQETFGHLGNEQYAEMAYQVARFHHEKWNGKGYPEGLKRKEIPLCARIMAIADVFDAVSEKRCYREAMPLNKCFEIIQEGSGQDFDPVLAEVFLDIRDKVEEIHKEFNQ